MSQVKLRGSKDGLLYEDLTRPVTVPAVGDVSIQVSTPRPIPVSWVEIVLIGCAGTGSDAYVPDA